MAFMTKNLSKKLMTKSRLRNKYLKHKTEGNCVLYTQQRNNCTFLLRKTKINYWGNLDDKKVSKNAKPFLSDKSITK